MHNKLSIIHFNSRSLYENFNSIKDCLSQFKQPFSIIAISETWINSEKGADFDRESFELNYINREGKTGGGVAVYVDRNPKYKIVENMTTVNKHIFECITV